MSSSAGEKLPSEIIEEILYRLPVKSVARFKSVSKRWRSLISDPNFIKTHLHLRFHQTKKLILFSILGGPIYSVNINQLLPYLKTDNTDIDIFATAKKLALGSFPMKWLDILGSYNGLVLARDFKGMMFLMNPTTIIQEHELWEVPPTPFQHNTYTEFDAYCGFGYDSITDDYKLVWISYPKHNSENLDTYVSLYSLRNNSWKKLPNPPRVMIKESCGAVVNHNYHWLTISLTEVIAFSFADEVFSEIKPPNNVFETLDTEFSSVVEIGGKLDFFVDFCELWVMHEYGNNNSWTRVFSHQFTNFFRPVYLVEGSNRNIVLEDITKGEVVVFNIDERRCRRIVGGLSGFYIRGTGTFVESIESPQRVITTP